MVIADVGERPFGSRVRRPVNTLALTGIAQPLRCVDDRREARPTIELGLDVIRLVHAERPARPPMAGRTGAQDPQDQFAAFPVRHDPPQAFYCLNFAFASRRLACKIGSV